MKNFILFFVFQILFSYSAYNQVVNVEKKRKTNKDGWQGSIALSLQMEQNTKQILSGSNKMDLQYQHKQHLILFLNELSLLQVNKEEALVNTGFQHLRYNYTVRDTGYLTWEFLVQHQYNKVKLLQTRFVAAAGLRLRLINNEKVRLYIAALPMFEYEKLTDDFASIVRLFRLDSYLSFSFLINENLSFRHIMYVQPSFNDFADLRIAGESNLNFKISKRLSFKLGFNLSYDSQPPVKEGVIIQDLFYKLSNTLVYSF